jgi:alpha-tubulin suppressor-like RCC1 family protein
MRHRSALAAGMVCVLTAAIYGCAREPAAPRPTPESSAEAHAATLDLAVATILSGSSSLSTSVSDLSSGISTAVANLASGGAVIQAAVFAGGKSTCYVRDGEAECWGQNRTGQLGDGTTEDRSAPVPVTTAEGPIAALALGYTNACALMEAGDIVCWGSGVSFFPESGAQAACRTVSVGAPHACGVSAEGEVLCW